MGWEAVVVGLLAGVVAGLAFGRWGRGGDGVGAGRELDRRLAGISDSLDRRLVDLDRRLYLGLDSVQDAQARAADTAAQVRERVAVVAGVAEQVLEQARGLSRLEDLLRPPQARGAVGELLLEQLLAQGLPHGAYRTQHVFRSGARVDAVLVVGEAMVAVDSKFPLEAFARMSVSADGDAARTLHRRAFVRDARRHVDAIADKYICPDEGTYDFALCYLPSEAVFYEFLREDPVGDSCWRYAVERRVFPASPTTLYAYLVSIGVGLKGLRVEENARRVLDALAALRGDLDGFRTHFELVGRHLGRAKDRWQDAAHRLDRFDGRLAEASGRATDLDRGLPEPEAEPGGTGGRGSREPAEPGQGHGGPGDEEEQAGGGEDHRDLLLLLDEADLGAELPIDLLEVAVAGGGEEAGPGGLGDPLQGEGVGRDRDPAQVAGLIGHVDHPPVGAERDGEHRHPELPWRRRPPPSAGSGPGCWPRPTAAARPAAPRRRRLVGRRAGRRPGRSCRSRAASAAA